TKLFETENAATFVGSADQRATSYFKLDPFKLYSKETAYPQNSNISFYSAEGDELYGSYDNTKPGGIQVNWDDNKVKISYKGSEDSVVVAEVSAADGQTYVQKIAFNVRVLNRTVTGYSNVFKGTGVPIKPYDYNNYGNLTEVVANDVFTTGEFKVHFGGYDPDDPLSVMDPDMPSITFQMGGTAEAHSVEGSDDLPFAEDTEKDLILEFKLDTARSITYKGKDARFYVTIPGFGMGAEGQQWASIDVPVEEQYILQVEYYYNGSYYPTLLEWAIEKYGASAITDYILRKNALAEDFNPLLYDLQSPYYFISMGGFELPTDVQIGVGPQGGGEADITKHYPIEVYWSNTASNKLRIYYNKETVKTSFQMDLDNQSFNLTFNVTPWILQDNELFFEGNTYGREEVIYLPGTAKDASVLTLTGTNIPNDTYLIKYPNVFTGDGPKDGTLKLEGVTGGGSFMDYVNKWNFEGVEFEQTNTQSALMTMGGRGGQVVKWKFYVANKILIGNTISTSYALLKGTNTTLPLTYKQIFAGYDYTASKDIPITYGPFTSFVIDYVTNEEGQYVLDGNGNRIVKDNTGCGYTATNIGTGTDPIYQITINGRYITPSKLRGESEDNPQYYPAFIEWDADASSRVYPNPRRSIGSKIIFTCYDWVSQDFTNTYGIYLHNPQATYNDDLINPGSDEKWKYPDDMPMIPDNTFRSDAENFIIPANARFYHYMPTASPKQSRVPIIKVEQYAKFDIRYLPTMSYRYYREEYYEESDDWWDNLTGSNESIYYPPITWDNVFVVPWENASTYYTYDWASNWKPAQDFFDLPLANGFRDIDTSKVGRRYTLKVNVRGGSLLAAIDIVYPTES
ncbi:MAG: hypothetical protein PHI19_06725, partial [Clostridia bacterium]|nr:hypothetical protein [Clostridia bacterium]